MQYLQSGADTQSRWPVQEAQKHFDELSILAGTAPAQGPGIRMRIADPNNAADAGLLLDAVEEMRDPRCRGHRSQQHDPRRRLDLVSVPITARS